MTKTKKWQLETARELTIAEREKLLLKMGNMIKAARRERTTLDRFVFEVKISKSQMIRHERGGDMLLSTFLKVLYGLDIKPDEFFRELEKKDI